MSEVSDSTLGIEASQDHDDKKNEEERREEREDKKREDRIQTQRGRQKSPHEISRKGPTPFYRAEKREKREERREQREPNVRVLNNSNSTDRVCHESSE